MGKHDYAKMSNDMQGIVRDLNLSAMTKTGWPRMWRLALARFFSWGVDIGREIDTEEKRNG